MQMLKSIVVLLGSILLPLSANVYADADVDVGADVDVDKLWNMLESQEQGSGRFVQELVDETDELLERSSGRYAVLRPDFFRWDIEYPDRQQILLARGDLWHYDIDLASATRRDAHDDDGFTPLELLGGKRAELEPRFAIEQLGGGVYRMIPRFAGAGFSAVEVSWKDGEIVAMDIRDRSGQLIRLELTPDENAAPLTEADFELVLPEGVEIFDPLTN